MKNKLLLILVIFRCAYGSQADVDTQSVSSKSSETAEINSPLFYEDGLPSKSSSTSARSSSTASSSGDGEGTHTGDAEFQDKVIDKTWGLKNLLSSTPEQDLYRSPLLGLIAVNNGTIKKWYGAFTDVPLGKQEEGALLRNKRVFVSHTSLERVTRAFFNVLDKRVRCSVIGSNPLIALSAQAIGELILVSHERGIIPMIEFLEKGLGDKENRLRREQEGKKKSQRFRLEIVPLSEEEAFVEAWWERYKIFPRKRVNLTNFRKNLHSLLQDLREMEKHQGAEKTIHVFSTLLMAFLVLKDESEGQKDCAYTVQDYFKKLKVDFVRTYYTTSEKKDFQKRLAKRAFGITNKDFEEIVFYLVSLAKNDFEFIAAPYTSAVFKETVKGEKREVTHALCAEVTVRSLINLFLFNPITQHFDEEMLPQRIQLNPLVSDFYFKTLPFRTDPQSPRYYAESADAWIQVIVALSKKYPSIIYKENELGAIPQNILLVLNKVFGTTVQSFPELGTALSKDGSQITIERVESVKDLSPPGKKGEWTIAIERDGLQGEDPYEFFVTIELAEEHAAFIFNMENIMPLIGCPQYRAIEELQKVYEVELWSIVLDAAAINAVIEEKTPFQEAIKTGSVPLVELLIEHGADTEQVDANQRGALFYAYISKNKGMIDFFTQKGLTLEVSLDISLTHLRDFIDEVGDSLSVELFNKLCDFDRNDRSPERMKFYSRILMVMLEENHTDYAKKLIKEGADVNYVEVIGNPEEGVDVAAPIVSALRGGTDELFAEFLMKALESAGDDKNKATAYGEALRSAITRKWIGVAKSLIKKGADVNFYTVHENDGSSEAYGVVSSASYGDDKQLMEMIVERLNPVGDNNILARLYGKVLYGVVSKGWVGLAVCLMENGAYMGELDKEMRKVLEEYGVLLEKKAQIDKETLEKTVEKKVHDVGEKIKTMFGISPKAQGAVITTTEKPYFIEEVE
jgi:hypothetical protein